jgi:BirA family biotin operon repressor/biotin-[acetyl-CoA-carboxylase] ligase
MTIDIQILSALRAFADGVSGDALSEELGVSRADIRTRIEELRVLGYEIESSPHGGYRLIEAPDRLNADDLLSRLGKTRVIGRDIRVFRETTSTNDIIEKLARDEVKEGVAVFAESQSRGRGRLGRKWLSPPGRGLWFSILLRPEMPPHAVTQLTIAASAALARGIEGETGLPAEIKWPNDVLIRGRKVAGVLTEMSAELDRVKYVVIGLGVDVNLAATDFSEDLRGVATSLYLESGEIIDRADLAAGLLRQLDRDYDRVSTRRFEEIADEWERRCTTLGRQVTIQVGDRRVQGLAESLDADGALLLRTQHGHLERIIGGDVAFAK